MFLHGFTGGTDLIKISGDIVFIEGEGILFVTADHDLFLTCGSFCFQSIADAVNVIFEKIEV